MSRTSNEMRHLDQAITNAPQRTSALQLSHPKAPGSEELLARRIFSRVTILGAPLLLAGIGNAMGLSVAAGLDASGIQEAAPEVQEKVSEDRGQKSLVHLSDGRVLRVRARNGGVASDRDLASGALGGATTIWQIRQGRDWIRLPVGMVERVVLERDALKAARKLAKELKGAKGKQDLGRHVAYASWLIDEGLLEEGAKELDSVLRKNPDQAQALELLRKTPIATNLPQLDTNPANIERSLQAFCKAAARSSTLGSEIAVQNLGDLADGIPDLEERLIVELHSTTSRRRAFAAHALRRLFPGEGVRPLLRRAILDASRDVRHEASLALRDVGDEAVLAPTLRALGSKQPLVRDHAVQAMAVMGYAAAVEPLVNHLTTLQSGGSSRPPHSNIFVGRQYAYVQDFDVEVAQRSAIADPIINVGFEGATLDAAVLGSSTQYTQTELANTRRALTQLTGQNPGHSVRAWQNWWAENKETWNSGPKSGSRSLPVSPDR